MSIPDLEKEILRLRKELQYKEEELFRLKEKEIKQFPEWSEGVPKWAIERYSRQGLVRELGPPRETLAALRRASVLVVGAGGLGCPSSSYLAGAGIGRLGIVDYDDVEESNIHRQLLHSEMTVGLSKAESASLALRRINSSIKITPYRLQLDSTNAFDVLRTYDVVVDATDNVVTRYLLNDACVMLGKPLVSASALKLEGQLTVYNYRPKDKASWGPCMRCIFPSPPPPAAVGSCSQNGVLGPVPGTLGALQAIETIKILLGRAPIAGSMLLFDGEDCSFRKVKLRGRNPQCAVCSDNPTVTKLIDYTQFCQSQASDKELKLDLLQDSERMSPNEFNTKIYKNILLNIADDPESDHSNFVFGNPAGNALFLDVRSEGEFEMCNIRGSRNLPIEKLDSKCEELLNFTKENNINRVFFICRRGNDSQLAVDKLKRKIEESSEHKASLNVKDVSGGLHAWAKDVDSNFPIY